MGGMGSGPYGTGGLPRKLTATECWRIDVRLFQRKGLLKPGCSFTTNFAATRNTNEATIGVYVFSDYIRINYTVTRNNNEETIQVDDRIDLSKTSLNYGGAGRIWFHCPHCSRRVAILYFRKMHFKCRHCQNLNYMSSQERGDTVNENFIRAKSILRKLSSMIDTPMDMMFFTPTKPKGMQWKTYYRVLSQYQNVVDDYLTISLSQLVGLRRKQGDPKTTGYT
jgi:hypothetical protein